MRGIKSASKNTGDLNAAVLHSRAGAQSDSE